MKVMFLFIAINIYLEIMGASASFFQERKMFSSYKPINVSAMDVNQFKKSLVSAFSFLDLTCEEDHKRKCLIFTYTKFYNDERARAQSFFPTAKIEENLDTHKITVIVNLKNIADLKADIQRQLSSTEELLKLRRC